MSNNAGGDGRFYVTTPIYYVNDKPHIGHAYTTIAADVLSRFHRAMGQAVFFLTGTDEHGQKVEKAAKELGVTPQEHCDRTAPRYAELWRRLRIEPSAFLRTTDSGHQAVVTAALRQLHAAGLIVKREFEAGTAHPANGIGRRKISPRASVPIAGAWSSS